jgi:glutamine synthetase
MVHMANRYILPAAFEYQRRVAETVNGSKAAGVECKGGRGLLDEVCTLACEFRSLTQALQHALDHAASSSAEAHAKHSRDKIVPAMNALREAGDKIEMIVPHDLWPLPTYREMLFLK